jgi:hypothetical protein
LGCGQGGDVTSDAEHAEDFAIRVRHRRADSGHDSNGAVPASVRFGKSELAAGANSRFEIAAKIFDIFNVQGSPEAVGAERQGGERDAEHTSQLLGPDELFGADAIFPRAKLGVFLGVVEAVRGGLEASLGEMKGGDIANSQNEAGRLKAGMGGSLKVGGEPGGLRVYFQGELKLSRSGGAEAAESGCEKA